MPVPTIDQIILKYLITILHYWWALLPGLVMPLRNIYKWLHPRHEELEIPHWVRLSSVLAAVFLAQFLAFQNSERNLAIVIEQKRQFSMALDTRSTQLQDANHEIDILKKQKPQPAAELKNSLQNIGMVRWRKEQSFEYPWGRKSIGCASWPTISTVKIES